MEYYIPWCSQEESDSLLRDHIKLELEICHVKGKKKLLNLFLGRINEEENWVLFSLDFMTPEVVVLDGMPSVG